MAEYDAMQFKRDCFEDIRKFTDGKATNFRTERCINGKSYCEIETLEGTMTAIEGDYIIKGVNGEFLLCKPDIFEKLYKIVKAKAETIQTGTTEDGWTFHKLTGKLTFKVTYKIE